MKQFPPETAADAAIANAAAADAAAARVRVEVGMAAAVNAQRVQWRASAELFRAIDDTLAEAVAHPEVFLFVAPARVGAMSPPSRDDGEFAERAAAADLAVRLSLAENTVRNHAIIAHTLRHRMPQLWAQFLDGRVSTPNAREAAVLVMELPETLWAEFETLTVAASPLAPARFRVRARAISEKLQAKTLTERHLAARTRRGVWTEIDRDGMGWLHAYLSAEKLAKVTANLDGIAIHLFRETDETRTMAQLRADALSDLITGPTDPDAGCSRRTRRTRRDAPANSAGRADGSSGAGGSGVAGGTGSVDGTSAIAASGSSTGSDVNADVNARKRPPVGVTVALTIPVLTLLGRSTDPALLEGVGPIDIDTARSLAATVPSITRLLTDPVSGTIIDMDPKQYRVPAALKRWLAIEQVTCDFPGCGRRADNCDLDHTRAWADGGTTTAANLAHRCRKHHTMKHRTKWQVEKPPGSKHAVWTSPTGYRREADPAPF